jgi:sRNA-binding carbon storage regulator CsrA
MLILSRRVEKPLVIGDSIRAIALATGDDHVRTGANANERSVPLAAKKSPGA